jgi:4-diphosphocytidyl-2-C-methyl-D-erythritol kinase
MKLRAFAKINLSLRVFTRRPDGFHAIESIMQSVSLCDYITLTPNPSGIEVTCDDPKVPQGKDNLAHKAARAFQSRVASHPLTLLGASESRAKGSSIHIEKRIPMAAGLAGGSADAAAVLYGLNQLAGDGRMPAEELLKLGAEVGSDVPFCLTGGTCLVEGRGEIVNRQEPWPKTFFVLVCPDLQVSTKWAYEEFDNLHLNLGEEIKNDLEPVVVSKFDEITEIKEKLLRLGCLEAQMSGSGPSIFGSVKHRNEAERILAEIREDYSRSFLVETVGKGVEV